MRVRERQTSYGNKRKSKLKSVRGKVLPTTCEGGEANELWQHTKNWRQNREAISNFKKKASLTGFKELKSKLRHKIMQQQRRNKLFDDSLLTRQSKVSQQDSQASQTNKAELRLQKNGSSTSKNSVIQHQTHRRNELQVKETLNRTMNKAIPEKT